MDKDFGKRLVRLLERYENATEDEEFLIKILTFINAAWDVCINVKGLKNASNDVFFMSVAILIVVEEKKCFKEEKNNKNGKLETEIRIKDLVKIKNIVVEIVKQICEQNDYKGDYMDFREPIFVDPTTLFE
jgi:hypothetical protein